MCWCRIPTVLRADLYAVAALAGAVLVVVGHAGSLVPTRSAERPCASGFA